MKFLISKRHLLLLIFSALQLSIFAGCSQPVLESKECISSREAVRSFYSFHFGNDMTPTPENLKKREKYLSKALKERLSEGDTESKSDYFTQTADYPKAFRVGACESAGSDRVTFEVLLFWRTDGKDRQQEITVVAVEESGTWLIDRVDSGE
ncbi:MAG: DUF3828 domain-containing protein [Pyrinomonadaceae bacterium]|nr:DUF3828 domain-containing protein [Pyrinomonadaceae bacterium]